MRVLIHPTEREASVWVARHIAARINSCLKQGDGPFVLGLPTGTTPLGVYRELIRLYEQGKVSFANVVTFNMDEYVGLPADHPQSYHYFMWENFFRHVDVRPENVNILNGMAKDIALECGEYEEKIAEADGIDLFLGGVGSDGHIAFNEPFSSLASRTRMKTLTDETIVANSRLFNDISEVPRTALTVGVGTILDADEVIILATGFNKARALHHAIEGSYNHQWTVSALQTHRNGMIVCDEDAANELQVSTYRYFKNLEKDHMAPAEL
ncbi:MAG: glucosamine-6-phosphate deaminase [Rikenellaceae bacterium]|jgi:glucosamine-6-phosphate deaminase|nr:glucosamine-6-phosphate deaminase [Rikenellaceae bacterium]